MEVYRGENTEQPAGTAPGLSTSASNIPPPRISAEIGVLVAQEGGDAYEELALRKD